MAVTTRCDGSIAVHAKKALELGVTKEEIIEALGIAIALNAGAAPTYSARVFDAIESLPAE
ncbi:carboxymuconolactone decarboxylase family protein [Brucella grignonensis]|uniref:Alkylhydroperoxidase AhpD family core domain protein n=1 Tax=Brucella grignonensis TaxID=94627 RepID=A0A256F0Y6_9HYPH|nr:carboxymuconolactone decarboxylase family protein [Brucella grignonensis]OYR08356.1 alkylhydroperoxidase AhpD family core domain protein [Brucella grignonensis]